MTCNRLLVLAAVCLAAEPVDRATQLVKFLTYRFPYRPYAEMGLFSCGQVTAETKALKLLIALGEPALPAIERELSTPNEIGITSIERAYASLRGADAVELLQRRKSTTIWMAQWLLRSH